VKTARGIVATEEEEEAPAAEETTE